MGITPTIQKGKLRPGSVKYQAQGHIARKWHRPDGTSGALCSSNTDDPAFYLPHTPPMSPA